MFLYLIRKVQIAELLRKDDDLPAEQLRGMLALKRSELAREMRETEQRLVQVEARLAQLEQGDGPSPYEIVVKSVAAMPVASLKQWMPHDNEMSTYCKSLTRNLFRKLKAVRIAWS